MRGPRRVAGASRPRAFAVRIAVLAGCGGSRSVGDDRPATALESAYPVLRWVPADASYVAVTARVGEGVLAARELAGVASAGAGVDAAELDRQLRAALGVSPIDAADLAAAGIDMEGSAALFGQQGFPTIALPVADTDQLGELLERPGAATSEHRGHAVRSWREGELALSSVALDGWLLLHLGPRDGGPAWLDAVLAAPGAGMGADEDLAAAVSRGRRALGDGAGERAAPGLVGLVRLAPLARDMAGWPDAPDGLAACARRASAAAPRLLWAAEFTPQDGTVWAALDLAPGAARALRESVVEPPPAGFVAYRDAAALSLGWSVELGLLERARAALSCPGLEEPLRDPVREATGFRGPRGWHVAATSIDLDDMSGAGAMHLVLADRNLIAAQLESIPARSLFERTRRVAGVPVQVLSVPGLPTIMYRLAGPRFTLAVGDRVMAEVLASEPEPAEARNREGGDDRAGGPELAQLRIQPQRLPQLGQLLATALSALAVPAARATAAAIAERLSQYEEAALSARLDGNSVAISARMRRVRAGHSTPTRRPRTSLW